MQSTLLNNKPICPLYRSSPNLTPNWLWCYNIVGVGFHMLWLKLQSWMVTVLWYKTELRCRADRPYHLHLPGIQSFFLFFLFLLSVHSRIAQSNTAFLSCFFKIIEDRLCCLNRLYCWMTKLTRGSMIKFSVRTLIIAAQLIRKVCA